MDRLEEPILGSDELEFELEFGFKFEFEFEFGFECDPLELFKLISLEELLLPLRVI